MAGPDDPIEKARVWARRKKRKFKREWRSQLVRHGRQAKRVALRRGEPVHMLHIGKTGGTAVKEALEPLRASGPYALELHDHPTLLMDVPIGERVFFVVRDPVQRFVSGFNSRLRQGRPRHDLWWTPAEKVAFEHFPTADSLGCALSDPDGARRAQAFAAMTSITHVRDSYWQWFRHRGYLNRRASDLLMILWFGDLNAGFERLCGLLELPGQPRLPTDEVRAHRSPSDVDKRLSDRAARNLAWWYSRDYALIEYLSGFDSFMGPSWRSIVAQDGSAWADAEPAAQIAGDLSDPAQRV